MLEDEKINYDRIAKAQLVYRTLGYKHLKTPWIVGADVVRATLPTDKLMVETATGVLVGSGEQGFIQELITGGSLEPGSYQTTTPCFWGGEEPFLKIDLICYAPEDQILAYQKVMNDALSCFFQISDAEIFDQVQHEQNYTLCLNDMEIGSYGLRRLQNHVWAYGTGLMEPRFSLALSHRHEHEHTHAVVVTD